MLVIDVLAHISNCGWTSREPRNTCMGPSIKYVTLFLANFDPSSPLSHFVTHPGNPPESTSHISDPPIFSRPSTKNPDKSPFYKFSHNCSRGFCQGVFCLEGFVRGGFCPFPFYQNTSVTSVSYV